jgi:hypothetical protein
MNGQGAKSWEELEELTLKKSNIAIVLDNIVFLSGVSSGPIAGGRSEIRGTLM